MGMKRHRNTTKRPRWRQKKEPQTGNLLYKSRAEVILDDEKYFYFNGDNMPGSAR